MNLLSLRGSTSIGTGQPPSKRPVEGPVNSPQNKFYVHGERRAPTKRTVGNLFGLVATPDKVKDIDLPKKLMAQLKTDRKNWLKTGSAPGPLFVNGDIARQRFKTKDPDDPKALSWLTKGGATELALPTIASFIGREIELTPTCIRGDNISREETVRVVVTDATERLGFVSWQTAAGEVPFYNGFNRNSYVGLQHGHEVREVQHEAYRPSHDYTDQTVYARVFRGGKQRSVGAPVVGQVTAQDEKGIEVVVDGEKLRLNTPEEGFLQVLPVPATALPAPKGTKNWMRRFAALEEIAGQRLCLRFDPVSPHGSIEAQLSGVEQTPDRVVVKYRSDEGVDMQSEVTDPGHVVLLPSTKPHTLLKSRGLDRSFIGQIVDATLVEKEITSVGYGQHCGTKERVLSKTRGSVVDQTAEKLVIQATNGERIALDLTPFATDEPLDQIHNEWAESYILVKPHGRWSVD